MTHQTTNPNRRKLTDRERSAMWHAKVRCERNGIAFHLQAELAAYHARINRKTAPAAEARES